MPRLPILAVLALFLLPAFLPAAERNVILYVVDDQGTDDADVTAIRRCGRRGSTRWRKKERDLRMRFARRPVVVPAGR